MVTDLHLPLDKVLGLSERTDELLTFFPFEDSDFLFVDYIGDFKLLFFLLKLVLFVDQLLAKDPFFVVKVKENIEVLLQLVRLLLFDNPVDLPLLLGLLSVLLLHGQLILNFSLLDLGLFMPKLLGLPLGREPSLLSDQ
jgi:hypothetical protein